MKQRYLLLFIIFVFLFAIIGFIIWKNLEITQTYKQLSSIKLNRRKSAFDKISSRGSEGLNYLYRYYEKKYNDGNSEKRIRIVDDLSYFGQKGKDMMKNIFINYCKSNQIMIPAGTFMMGCESGEDDEKPVHEVYLNTFFIDKYEVTNEKYYVFVKVSGYESYPIFWKNGKIPRNRLKHPIVGITWKDATEYSKWIGMRLPTEAEWEYAAKHPASSVSDYQKHLDNYAWTGNNSEVRSHTAGELKPNSFGLYDMFGNVYEFCSDWYFQYYYSKSPRENPKGPIGGHEKVIRGGAWNTISTYCTRTSRMSIGIADKSNAVGFRVVR